eukprot:symbB.v1.2.040916.t1/scaffold7651.1/size10055/1
MFLSAWAAWIPTVDPNLETVLVRWFSFHWSVARRLNWVELELSGLVVDFVLECFSVTGLGRATPVKAMFAVCARMVRVFVLRVMIFVILLLQPAASAAEKILALQGGGIRALSSDAGLIAGVARVSQLSRNGVEKGAFDRLDSVNVTAMLQGFDSVSSVSGSSWFAAEFFFSSSFVEMLAGLECTSSPSTAAQQFDEQWIRPWLLATDVQEPRFDSFQVLVRLWVKLLLGTGDEDTIFLAQFFLATGFTWNHFVDVLLMSTGGISNSTLILS